MKCSVLLCALLSLVSTASTALADKPKIAVMRFEAQSAGVKDKVDQLTAELSGQLADLGDFIILPDNEVSRQQKRLCSELTVCDPKDVAPDLGRNLHADWVFVPYVTMEDGFIRLTVTVISISTAAQSSGYRVSAKGGIAEVYESIPRLVEQAEKDQALFLPKDGGGAGVPTAVQDDLNAAELLAKQGKAAEAREHANAARKGAADNHVVLQRALAVYETIGDADRALETVNAWLNLASTANLPSRREMTKKQIQIKDNLAEIKRIGEQATEILGKLQQAFDRKDAENAWRLYEELQKLKPDHPGIAAWKTKMDTLEAPAQREQRLAREKREAEIREIAKQFDAAVEKKNADAAYDAFEALRKLDSGNSLLATWEKKLEALRPPWEGFFPMTADQARNVQKAAASRLKLGDSVTVDVGGGVKMELVLIPAGEFQMGSPDTEEDRDGDEVRHKVRLSKAFYMGKYEVTQAQWQAVLGSNPSRFKGDDLPVEKVWWDDCQEFCRKLSQKTGKTMRLPTEAEWEYACRAGSTSVYSGGDPDDWLGNVAWYDKNSDSKTHAVGGKRANAWGLYDMHGNVWEWCQDWYGEYPSGSVTDPTGPRSGSGRVLRGGSWDYGNPGDCRSASRSRDAPVNRGDDVGFRVVSGTP